MTVYFTSDLHLGHRNIIDFCRRPFHNVDNMNKLLIHNWNEVVAADDTVYVLGDFAMGQIADTLPLARQLNGHKLLIPGNHDRCWSHHPKRVDEWRQKYEEVGFTILPETVRLPVNGENGGEEIRLCHFPYEGDSQDTDRYVDARPFDDGMLLLHGHTHSSTRRTTSTLGTAMFNVGVDANHYYPVTLSDLMK